MARHAPTNSGTRILLGHGHAVSQTQREDYEYFRLWWRTAFIKFSFLSEQYRMNTHAEISRLDRNFLFINIL